MKHLYCTTLLGIWLLAGAAAAQAGQEPADSAADNAPESELALYGDGMKEGDMEASRGAGVDPVSIAQLEAVNAGNTIISGNTGYNAIGGDAFGNASGLINIIQNSGNGVVIQNSMIVNVTMQ